ncbi:unnamed protein product [Urochloa humidicola]
MAADAEARTATALLLSFSAVALLLLARRAALADLRSILDGLATRRNMVLLCHAILLLILRDAGILGATARRRGAATGDATSFASSTTVVFTSVVVWRRNAGSGARCGRRACSWSGRRRGPNPISQQAAIATC